MAKLKSGTTIAGSTAWHAGNDGSGSGLDADTLDGNHASAFLTEHPDISAASSSNNSGRTYIQDITVDSNGHVTGIATATETVTDTNTNQLTTFQLEDGDGTEVTISHGKEVKFLEGGGIDINWTDTSTGSDGDPYDLAFTVTSAPKWTVARTLSLTGDVTGSASWDGSANASISTTLNEVSSLTVDGHTLQDSADRSGLLELTSSLGTWRGIQIKPTSTSLWSIMGSQEDFGLYDDYNGEWIIQYNENDSLQLYSNGTNGLTVGADYIEIPEKLRHQFDTDTYLQFLDNSMLFYTGGAFTASMYSGGIEVPQYVRHHNDADTYMEFHGSNSWRVVTGGNELLEATTSGVRISDAFTLPTSDGSQDQVLTTDGNGNTSWATPASGGGGPTVVKSTEVSYADIGVFGESYSHGQSSAPDMVYMQLLIKAGEDGWSTGDVINIYSTQEFDEDDYVLNCYGNSSVIGVQYNNKGTLLRYMPSGPGGGGGSTADVPLTSSLHRYRLVGVWF